MAESSTNFKKIFVKHGIEEEPVIVVQRFLNLFKQLHIFDEAQKSRFDKMILDFPAELRGMFKILPGGALLQDYVDDLETATGNVRDRSVNLSGSLSQDEPAAAGASAGASVAAINAGNVAVNGKIIADESFAKEITNGFSQAFKQNGENKQENERLALEGVLKTQSALFTQMAQAQGKELANAMVAALREAQELSIKSFIEAIKAIQPGHMQPYTASNSNPAPQASLSAVNGDDEWDYVEVDADEAGYPDNSAPVYEDKPSVEKSPVTVAVPAAAMTDVKAEMPKPSAAAVIDDFDLDALEKVDASPDSFELPQALPASPVAAAETAPAAPLPESPAAAPQAPASPSPAAPNTAEEDWEFQEAQSGIPDPETHPEIEEENEDSSENEDDWEWEYEVADANAQAPAPNPSDNADTLNASSPLPESAEGEEDWEWEYEEVPEGERKDEEGEVLADERFVPSQPANIPSKNSL